MGRFVWELRFLLSHWGQYFRFLFFYDIMMMVLFGTWGIFGLGFSGSADQQPMTFSIGGFYDLGFLAHAR